MRLGWQVGPDDQRMVENGKEETDPNRGSAGGG